MPFTNNELAQLAKDPQLSPEERRQALTLLSEQLKQPAEGWDKMSGLEKANRTLGTGGRMLELGGGMIPNPLVRVPAVALGSFMSGRAEGDDLGELATRVGSHTALESIFPGVSKAKSFLKGRGLATMLPEAGLQLGLRFGGLKGDIGRSVDAFIRERGRHGWGGGILPGTIGKTARRRAAAGTALEAVERNAPGDVALADVVKPALKQVNVFGPTDPHKLATAAVKNQKAFLRKPHTVRGFPNNVGHPSRLNVRELGDVKRTQQREASKLIESRLSGASPYDPTNVGETMAASRAKLIKEAQEQIAPGVVPINEQLSDLLSIQNVNKTLRGGGGLVQDIGGMGIRGGVGAGVGGSLFGRPGARFGGLLGMTILNPKLAAALGFAGGRTAEVTPTMARLLDLMASHERNKR